MTLGGIQQSLFIIRKKSSFERKKKIIEGLNYITPLTTTKKICGLYTPHIHASFYTKCACLLLVGNLKFLIFPMKLHYIYI